MRMPDAYTVKPGVIVVTSGLLTGHNSFPVQDQVPLRLHKTLQRPDSTTTHDPPKRSPHQKRNHLGIRHCNKQAAEMAVHAHAGFLRQVTASPLIDSLHEARMIHFCSRSCSKPGKADATLTSAGITDPTGKADGTAGQPEEGVFEFNPSFPSHGQTFELVEQGEGLFDDVAESARPLNAPSAVSGSHGQDPADP